MRTLFERLKPEHLATLKKETPNWYELQFYLNDLKNNHLEMQITFDTADALTQKLNLKECNFDCIYSIFEIH